MVFYLERVFSKAKGFSPDTYNGMVNAAATNATPDAQALLNGYNKKYASEISAYKKSTALAPVTNSSIPKPAPKGGLVGAWNKMSTAGKVGTVAGTAIVGGLALKGLFGGKKKSESKSY